MKDQRQSLQSSHANWQWPIDLSQYDRTPVFSEDEQQALDLFCTFESGDRRFLHPVELGHLQRLLTPLNEVLTLTGAGGRTAAIVRRQMLRGMSRHHGAYWGWSEEQWGEIIKCATGA